MTSEIRELRACAVREDAGIRTQKGEPLGFVNFENRNFGFDPGSELGFGGQFGHRLPHFQVAVEIVSSENYQYDPVFAKVGKDRSIRWDRATANGSLLQAFEFDRGAGDLPIRGGSRMASAAARADANDRQGSGSDCAIRSEG
jgi:hypothetical protein